MDFYFKILLIVLFILIFIQDYKQRLVYWFLYFFVGICGLSLQLTFFHWQTIAINFFINICFISILIVSGFLYCRLIKKEPFLNHSIGIGDIFMFVSLSFLLPTISFILFFVFSLIFSLMIHLLLKEKYTINNDVPLAGYMSLFFSFILLFSFFLEKNWLFIL